MGCLLLSLPPTPQLVQAGVGQLEQGLEDPSQDPSTHAHTLRGDPKPLQEGRNTAPGRRAVSSNLRGLLNIP